MESEVGKQCIGQSAPDFCERIAVVKKKRRAPVARFEKPESFQQGQLGCAARLPFFCNRRVSFRVNASLRAASFAESAVDLGDR